MGSIKYLNTSGSWRTAQCVNPFSSGYGAITTMRNNIASGGDSLWEIWDSRY